MSVVKQEVESTLSELFGNRVHFDIALEREIDSAKLVVGRMKYRRDNGPGDVNTLEQRVQQSAVVFRADDLDVPEFALGPRIKGLLRTVVGAIGGLNGIEFDDSPGFTEEYRLQGWNEQPVRILFTPELRRQLGNRPGWSVRGKGHLLVVFRQNQLCPDGEREAFVTDALAILAGFRQGEHELDARPDIRRETTAADMLATAGRMGGMVGSMLQKQLNKLALTREELDAFLTAAPPRTVPAGMNRQVLGDNFPLIIVGFVFVLGGLVAGGSILALTKGANRLLGLVFLLVPPLVGGLMSFLTIRHRNRKARVLQEGDVVAGRVKAVTTNTVMVNGQVQCVVNMGYTVNGREYESTTKAYGDAAARAKSLAESGAPVQILVDPQDESHIVCVDLLTMFDG